GRRSELRTHPGERQFQLRPPGGDQRLLLRTAADAADRPRHNLTGRFFGDAISGDSNNRAFCCADAPPDNRCAAVDSFLPSAASAGRPTALSSTCARSAATGVRIGGIAAPFAPGAEEKGEVPAPRGAAGACPVQVLSPAGTYTAAGTLTVS